MKLTKQQMEALASKFQNELKTKAEQKAKKIESEKGLTLKPDFDKACKLLKENDFLKKVEFKLNNSNYSASIDRTTTFNSFLQKWDVKSYLKTNSNYPSKSDIIQDIILATIDASSVEEIMKSLNKKYK